MGYSPQGHEELPSIEMTGCTTYIHYLGIYIISRDLDYCDVEWFALETNGDYLSPLDCKEIQPVHPKGDQSWVFIGRTDVEAETLILWPPNKKS